MTVAESFCGIGYAEIQLRQVLIIISDRDSVDSRDVRVYLAR